MLGVQYVEVSVSTVQLSLALCPARDRVSRSISLCRCLYDTKLVKITVRSIVNMVKDYSETQQSLGCSIVTLIFLVTKKF